MSVYLDTSQPGGPGPLKTSGQVFYFGAEVDFYVSVASNLILGQATGPSVQFVVYSRRTGMQPFQVDYGTTNTQYPVKYTGYLINVLVPTSGGSVSCRVVVSSTAFPLSVITVPPSSVSIAGTVSTSIDAQTVGVAPAISLAGGAIDPRLNKPALQSPGPTTVVETESGVGQSVGVSTTLNTGSSNIPKGTLVTWSLGITSYGLTAPNCSVIVIMGASSLLLYAVVQGPASLTGTFYMTQTEKLNTIGYGGGAPQQASFSWQATNP